MHPGHHVVLDKLAGDIGEHRITAGEQDFVDPDLTISIDLKDLGRLKCLAVHRINPGICTSDIKIGNPGEGRAAKKTSSETQLSRAHHISPLMIVKSSMVPFDLINGVVPC
ncbi:MAG: hypothetical protein ACF8LL_03715, partial [Phycisphaerales bacterium]